MSRAWAGWLFSCFVALAILGAASCGHEDVTGQVPQLLVSVCKTEPANGAFDVAVSDTPFVELLDKPDGQTLAVTEFNMVAHGVEVPGRVVFEQIQRQPNDCSPWRISYITDAPLSGHTPHALSITTGVRLVGGRLVRDALYWTFVTGDSGTIATSPEGRAAAVPR